MPSTVPTPALPTPNRVRLLGATVLLALLSLAGNYFNLQLFFGVDILFGSVAVWVALVWLGTWPGLLVALIGSAYTLALWDHPYAMIILLGEAGAVAWHRARARGCGRDEPMLAVSVTLYWLLIGIPLILIFYHWGLGMAWRPTLLIAVKQAFSGILNAALAGLVLLVAAALGRGGGAQPVGRILFSVLLLSLLLPSLLITTWQNRDLKDRLEAEQAGRLVLLAQIAEHERTVSQLLVALLALACAGVALAAAMSRRLVHPLKRLVEATTALPAAIRENQPWRAPEAGWLRETGQLADAVTVMAASLTASFRALAQEQDEQARQRCLLDLQAQSLAWLVTGQDDEATFADRLCRHLQSVLPGHHCTLIHPGPQGVLQALAAPGLDAAALAGLNRLLASPRAPCGYAQVMETGAPTEIPDMWADERCADLPAEARRTMRSGWALPIIGRDQRALGVLALGSPATGCPPPFTRDLMEAAATLAGLALDSLRLRRHHELLEAALSQAGTGIMVSQLVGEDFLVSYANRGCETLTGYGAAELLGRDCRFLQGEDRDQPGRHQMRTALAAGLPCHATLRNYRKDGTRFWNSVNLSPIRDRAGQVTHYIAVQQDVTEAMETTLRLRRSEGLLMAAQAIAHLGSWELDMTSPAVVWSDETYRLLGYQPRTLVPTLEAFFAAVPPAEHAAIHAVLATARAQPGRVHQIEHRVQGPDGVRRILLTQGRLILDPRGQPRRLTGTCLDITARKEAQQALLKAQELAKLGSWELDFTTDRLSWSPEALRIYEQGPEPSATSYAAVLAAMHPQDRDLVDRTFRAAVANRTPYDLVHRVLLPGGRIKWIHARCETDYAADGRPLLSRGTIQDITERKEAELALEAERQRLSNIILGTRVGTWEWEVQTGAARFNERWAEILGYRLADLAPTSIQTWLDLCHPQDLQTSHSLIARHLSGELPSYECEARLRHRDGHWVWVLDQGRVMEWDAAGAPRLMAGIHQDITARKHAELALAQRESMLGELLALAAQFVGAPDQGLDALTAQALERVGRFGHADRSYLFRLDESRAILTNTLEWTADGVAPMIAQGQAIPLTQLPELTLRLRLGEPVAVPRVAELPADWSRERAIFESQGIRSLLIAPLAVGEVLLGGVGLDAVHGPRDWSPVEVHFLQVFASILAGAMDRARTTQDLRASNARYEELARQSRSISWEIDPEGRYTYVSPVCEQVLGYRAAELIGRHFYDRLPAQDREAVKAAAFAIMERREPIRDFDRLCLGVEDWRVWLMSSGAPMYAPDGTYLGYRGIDTDITDRHLAQDLIRESEARLSAVFENAPIGMALVGPDRRLTLVNRSLAAFLGRTQEELTGMGFDQVTHPDELDRNPEPFAELQAGGKSSYRITKHYLRPDGSTVWGDVRVTLLPTRPGAAPLPLAMLEDVTELHTATQRQHALEEALIRYAAQLEELVDLINRALPRAEQDRALLGLGCRALGAASAVLGLVEDGALHRVLIAVPDLATDGPGPALLQAVLAETLAHCGTPRVLGAGHLPGGEAGAGPRSCIGISFDAPRPDGPGETLILSLWGAAPVLDLGDPERQMIRLIAQRIAAVRYQEQIQRDLVESRERETIGHLASGVAHDFNNLLGVIDANIYFLSVGLPHADTDPELRQVLAETQSALGQAKVITSGMLSLSRAGGVPQQAVDLAQTVAELVGILRQVLPPGIRLSVDIAPGLKARTNAGFLQAALLNLALNARDAMPAGGDLRIAARPAAWSGDAPLAVGVFPPQDCMELRVTDTGTGIDPAILPRIFDPLFSTKAKQRGHGLGLFMVQEFIARTGAGLTVESHPQIGTCFRILLAQAPAAAPPPDPDRQSSPPGDDADTGMSDGPPPGLRVLVVDDDPRVREAVARLLALDGVAFGQAEHGEAALAVLSQDPGYDLVLSDIAMPGLDGLGLYRHLARKRPGLPVILMTGQDSALPIVGDPHERPLVLRKPIDPPTLRAALHTRGRPGRDEE